VVHGRKDENIGEKRKGRKRGEGASGWCERESIRDEERKRNRETEKRREIAGMSSSPLMCNELS
jgi:hypothetical protein